jgi:hypothetical protein
MSLKVFESILNMFTNIVIGISPLHSHYNIFVMCTHIYICFSLSTMTPFPTCFITILFSPISLIHFNFHTFYKNITYQFLFFMFIHHPTFQIPHYMLSVVVWSIVEPKLIIKDLITLQNPLIITLIEKLILYKPLDIISSIFLIDKFQQFF